MAELTRTFIAIPIPSNVSAKLGRLQSLVAPDAPGARWVVPASMHITLAFLGDVGHADLAGVCRAVADAAAGLPPFPLHLQGLGAFPDPERPRTVWAGISGPGVETLIRVQKQIVAAVAGAGYPPADDRFHPHVTLGRIKTGKGPATDLRAAVRQHAGWAAGTFEVAELVTFASTLGDEGPSYNALSRAPLRGRKNGALA